jgi:autotransporter-associated beta strand protein
LTKAGAGTLVLSGDNTYVGVTTINAGTLVVGVNAPLSANGALGNASSAVLLGNTATADNASLLIGGAFTVSRAITVRSGNTGVMTLGGSADNNSAFTGAIGLQKDVTITQAATTAGNALTISGGISATTAGAKTVTFNNAGDVTVSITAIADGSGTIAVVKQGAGTLNLNVASTYTGGTTLGAGHLSLGADNVLPNTGLFTFAGGILDANSHTDTIGPLSLTASSTLNLSPGGASGTLTFASMTAAASTVWTINGWTGDAGTDGADDHIFISADPGATVLGQIQFTGFAAGALRLGTGEIVPVPEPINIALGVFGAVFLVFGLGRRLYASPRFRA